MTTHKKLDTFVIKDKFNLSNEALFDEAQACAFRRAEMMEWPDVVAIRTSDVAFSDGEFLCHTFDLVSVESIGSNDSDNSD